MPGYKTGLRASPNRITQNHMLHKTTSIDYRIIFPTRINPYSFAPHKSRGTHPLYGTSVGEGNSQIQRAVTMHG